MDAYDAHWYGKDFEIAFLRAKGDAFQTFFEELMKRAYKADFMACSPWGNVGDKKNDGFLKSERRLFQVYAPLEMTEAKAKAKIIEDFEGALQHWGKLFDKWTFVHNAEALPPHVQELILQTERDHSGVKIDPWSLEELRDVFRKLERHDLQSWFNFTPPTRHEIQRVGFEDIRVVLADIETREHHGDVPVQEVPPGKIKKNRLSPSVQGLLSSGMMKAPMVREFFSEWHNPSYGEDMAKAFRLRYVELRDVRPVLHPNQIFDELFWWVLGDGRHSAQRQAASLAVLAYFFEKCDIFEPPDPIK